MTIFMTLARFDPRLLLMRQMIAKQAAVAGNAVAGLEQAQTSPQAHRVVREHRLAELALQPFDHAHGRPIAARHDDGVGVRPVGAAPEVIGFFRTDAAELDRSHEPDHLAVDDLETAQLHELHHGLVHGLAPRRAYGDPFDAEPRERVHERGRRRGGGPARSILHALDQLAVVTLAFRERWGGRCKYDDVDLGVGELAAFAFELEDAAILFLRGDVAVGHARGVQRDGWRQRRGKFRLLHGVGGGRQQAEAMGLFDVSHPLYCEPSRPAAWMTT